MFKHYIEFIMFKKFFLFIIKLYRYLLSPYIGQHCRFQPTCSHYAEQAIQTYGAGKGGYLAMKRLLRCHPFAQGGYDPLPYNKK